MLLSYTEELPTYTEELPTYAQEIPTLPCNLTHSLVLPNPRAFPALELLTCYPRAADTGIYTQVIQSLPTIQPPYTPLHPCSESSL